MSIKSITLYINDMVCTSCEKRLEKNIKKLKGIHSVKADYIKGKIDIKYVSSQCNYLQIESCIKKCGYTTTKSHRKSNLSEILSIMAIISISLFIVILSNNSSNFNISSSLSSKVSYGVLFITGIFSSIHCIGMCGGLMLSQSISLQTNSKFDKLKPSLLYNSGRLISYTILGGIVGGLGSIFSLSTSTQGFISIFAGVFMVIMGLNIYGFKLLRKFSFKLPWSKCNASTNKKTSFIVGLLNGLMPCGPLQAMQLYALSTGSILEGASSMFFFALGTIPLMLVFGLISSLLTSNKTKKLLKFSGVIIIVLGISMSNRGFAIVGIDLSSIFTLPAVSSNINNNSFENIAVINGSEQTIRVSANSYGYSPKTIYVQKGIKTKLIIDGNTLTSCNNEIIFPSLNIRKKLSKGENIIEFTPNGGDITYSCWMGMKRAKIKVVDDINSISKDTANEDTISNESYENTEIEFYGIPLSKIPTSKLIRATEIFENEQKINVIGDVSDFDPLVIIARQDLPLVINFNAGTMTNANGEYLLLDNSLTNVISTLNISNNTGSILLNDLDPGAYAFIKDNRIFTILEVLSPLSYESIDIELLRKQYF